MKKNKMLAASAIAVFGLFFLNACSDDKSSVTNPIDSGGNHCF
ncbi:MULTISPECIES: hypothetical protein [unclassified Fibrobacter]|nr:MULTISPECIES: hypothetical protein [unclassified Fibrobacter]